MTAILHAIGSLTNGSHCTLYLYGCTDNSCMMYAHFQLVKQTAKYISWRQTSQQANASLLINICTCCFGKYFA